MHRATCQRQRELAGCATANACRHAGRLPGAGIGIADGPAARGRECPLSDGAVYDDPRDQSPAKANSFTLLYPRLIFKVCDPLDVDHSDRQLAEYRALPSVAAIVFVDLVTRTIELHERTGPAAWTQLEVAAGEALVLTDPAVTLRANEIFGDA